MRKAICILSALGVLFFLSGVALAQPEGAPKPGPEHKKLQRFVGKWSGTGELKPGPFGPGGPVTWKEKCDWFPGGFSLLCHSEGTGPMGDVKGLSVLSYDAMKGAYTYFGVDSTGWSSFSHGKVEGKTWTYSSEMTMGEMKFKARFILEEISDTEHEFKFEMSEDGSTWNTVMEGSSTKG